jgi:LysM repeat protein
MNRRQLAFIILFNAIISLVIALIVVWAVEARRPDPEALAIAAIATPVFTNNAPAVGALPNPTPVVEPAATTAVTPSPAATQDVGETEVYVVQAGDSLSSIADRFRIPIDTLVRVNELPNPDYVFVGQNLRIPVGGAGNDTLAPTATTATEAVTTGVSISLVEGPGDLLTEAVQLVNDNALAVNLADWVLTDGSASYTFGNLPLFPGSYIWLHSRAGEDTSVAVYWGRTEAAWRSGSTLQLRNPAGAQVATFGVP